MEIIIYIGALIIVLLLTRLFGAWMLRIDEVIKKLAAIEQLLKNKSRDEG